MELEWKPLALLLLFWALEGGNVWLCLRWPDFAYGALALYVGTCLLCIFASFGLGVPTIPRSRKPWMQALWYLALAGALPAALAFALLDYRDGEMEEPVADFFENVALCLTAMTLLLLWVGAADFVGTLGLQPLAEAGAKSWAPPAFLLASILWIVVVYNLTHVIGSVEASVAQDLPSPYGLGVYVAAVALWLASFARVLITRPGQPKDFQDSLQHRGGGMCLYCQAQKPQRCRHCTKCGACVLRMDHHCPWLRQCIGYGNYKYFVMFIFYSAVALGFKAVTMMIFILKAFQTEITFCTRLWLVSCEALVLALGVTMIAFASFHLLLVAKGMTTIEFLTRRRQEWDVPRFDINLDLPPELRYKEVSEHYAEEILAFRGTLNNKFTNEEQAQWLQVGAAHGEEFLGELRGVAQAVNMTNDMNLFVLFNMLYELESPTMCSGFLAADATGKVVHGRNMDYQFFFTMPDGSKKDWPDVTYEGIYWKGGQRIFTTINWPLWMGAHTAMRYDGWTFEQNTRLLKNEHHLNLQSAQNGGRKFGWVARKALETIPDFRTALRLFNGTKFMAPQYFIMAGAGDHEGAIISMDRNGAQIDADTPPVRSLSREGNWFLLQTNDDANKKALDIRRPQVMERLSQRSPEEVSVNFAWDVVHKFPLYNKFTAFTWVGVPSTNYSQVVVRGQDPVLEEANSVLLMDSPDEVQLAQRFRRKGSLRYRGRRGLKLAS
ncbi:unnamed protein product [Effrenium voratum]|uniref:Palmitoyltransferase n=1 Tax=Effrenium voratum TaxID=2562239 RepID=A0AA36JDD0_9DINO|nr:unnamed protein product [Effrenium voratum]